ncbi:MAG: hypothetical protein ACJ72L_14165 [Marmoricola sp.]
MQKRLVRSDDLNRAFYVADGLALDNSWATFRELGVSPTGPTVLDFSAMDYLDHETLLYIGALFRFRTVSGSETFISLPPEGPVWDFLRAWKFPEFIATVAGKDFSDVLTEGSRARYERDRHTYPEYTKVIDLPGGGTTELLPTAHFLITPIGLKQNPLRAATIARDSWLEKQTTKILDAYLGKHGERVGELVVLEAVLNAAMHPEATMAFTSSQIVLPGPDNHPKGRTLQIAVWDDGLSLAQTLKKRLDRGESITSAAFGEFDETFNVRLTRASGREEFRALKSNRASIYPDFPWLTVAAFMGGVSSLPDRSGDHTGDGIRHPRLRSNAPGMGLRYIRKNVLNLWGGSIRYWVGSYRFTMTATDDPDVYTVHTYYRPNDAWPLQGNLLFIDIPLKDPILASGYDEGLANV